MLEQNSNRIDFAQRLQEIIEDYNSGGTSNENYYDQLIQFSKEMKKEAERHVYEGLSEDELEIYDLIKKENLTAKEEKKVKLAAKHLIIRLREGQPKVLVQDWWKDGQTLAKVKTTVEEVLDTDLPASYDRVSFMDKCNVVFNLIVNFATHGRKWVA